MKVSCVLCHRSEETKTTGALSTKDTVTAHQNCLLFSSGIFCTASPLFDDLFGFSVKDVQAEVKRGSKLKCSNCKKKGATAGCEVGRCQRSYHYPCAVEGGAKIIEDEEAETYVLYCPRHNEQQSSQSEQGNGTVNGLASLSRKPTTYRDSCEAGPSKVCCLACEKLKGNISLESLSNTVVMLYCDKHAPSTYKMNDRAAGSSIHGNDSNSSGSEKRFASKRRLSFSDKNDDIPFKRKAIILDSSNSDDSEPDPEMEMIAPISSDLEDSPNSVRGNQINGKNSESPTGSTSANQLETKGGNTDEDETTVHSDAESESLLAVKICKEPELHSTTSATLLSPAVSERQVVLIRDENKDQGYSPEQKPVHSPDQHTAGPPVPQQGSTGRPPSPDLCTSRSVAGSPPCTSTATSPGPLVSPLPSSAIPSHVTHSSQSSIDSVSFWKSCNAAGCTQAIFADFFDVMNKISSRIQSDQASQEDYDLALKVIEDSGKLAELVDKQQKDLVRKQTELEKAAAAMKGVISLMKR